MAELNDGEYWFLLMWSYHLGVGNPQDIPSLGFFMLRLSAPSPEPVIEALVRKRVLELSPDQRMVKFTDYGLELFRATQRSQKEWESQPIARISTADRDQILVRAGETFKANRVLRDIFRRPTREVCVVDPYLGPFIFDLLEDANLQLTARLLTSTKIKQAAIDAYRAYRNQYGSVEMRLTDVEIHDRYILWDGAQVLHVGHSLKDLGTKDTQINFVADPEPQVRFFEERWAGARLTSYAA